MQIWLKIPFKFSVIISLLETLTVWSRRYPGEEIQIFPDMSGLSRPQRDQIEALLDSQSEPSL